MDPCLQGLASRLQKSVLSARAPSTTSTYHRAFKRWKDFAVSNFKGNYLPANPIHVAVYLQHVLESTKSCSSVDSAFYAINWAHEIAGMASPTDNQVVSRVREAAKRILGAGRPNRKEPLSTDVLKDIVEGADLSNILHLRNVCLYVLAYAGFFRSEEVLNIRMNHIHFHEGCMIIKVEKSKTDQLRQGDQVVIAQSGGSVCPVFLLKTYLRKLDIDPHSNEFIFRPLVKTKSSYKLTQKNKPISYTTFRDQLAKSLQNVVPDPSVYGTHSFRSGGASRAANNGVNDRLFQKHGRWKSVPAKNGYIKDDISSRLSVSKSLGL
ncbi:integrase/recombinase xerD homolog [Montipora capricornis]|uniref:integrase/recombinase xerD homolog n=1 Tax=Montipora capricornis TaxID=246305 RepID=UPI0035F1D0E8